MSPMLAIKVPAVALSSDCSQSFASLPLIDRLLCEVRLREMPLLTVSSVQSGAAKSHMGGGFVRRPCRDGGVAAPLLAELPTGRWIGSPWHRVRSGEAT